MASDYEHVHSTCSPIGLIALLGYVLITTMCLDQMNDPQYHTQMLHDRPDMSSGMMCAFYTNQPMTNYACRNCFLKRKQNSTKKLTTHHVLHDNAQEFSCNATQQRLLCEEMLRKNVQTPQPFELHVAVRLYETPQLSSFARSTFLSDIKFAQQILLLCICTLVDVLILLVAQEGARINTAHGCQYVFGHQQRGTRSSPLRCGFCRLGVLLCSRIGLCILLLQSSCAWILPHPVAIAPNISGPQIKFRKKMLSKDPFLHHFGVQTKAWLPSGPLNVLFQRNVGDGNCLWRAAAFYTKYKWYSLKRKTLQYMKFHCKGDYDTLQEITKLGKKNAWGNYLALCGIASCLNTTVHIASEDAWIVIEPAHVKYSPIFLSLHREHYSPMQRNSARTIDRACRKGNAFNFKEYLSMKQFAPNYFRHLLRHGDKNSQRQHGKCRSLQSQNQFRQAVVEARSATMPPKYVPAEKIVRQRRHGETSTDQNRKIIKIRDRSRLSDPAGFLEGGDLTSSPKEPPGPPRAPQNFSEPVVSLPGNCAQTIVGEPSRLQLPAPSSATTRHSRCSVWPIGVVIGLFICLCLSKCVALAMFYASCAFKLLIGGMDSADLLDAVLFAQITPIEHVVESMSFSPAWNADTCFPNEASDGFCRAIYDTNPEAPELMYNDQNLAGSYPTEHKSPSSLVYTPSWIGGQASPDAIYWVRDPTPLQCSPDHQRSVASTVLDDSDLSDAPTVCFEHSSPSSALTIPWICRSPHSKRRRISTAHILPKTPDIRMQWSS